MGHGRNKKKKQITKMYLKPLRDYCEQLEKQLEALKTDPDTTLGQVINQARELYTQNSRLSVLTAALLEAKGNKVTVKKSEMDRFENHRILIKWELPEGVEKAEDATEFVFLYEAIKNETPQQPIQVGPMAHASVPITQAAIEGSDVPTLGQLDPEIAGELEEVVLVEGAVEAETAEGESCSCPDSSVGMHGEFIDSAGDSVDADTSPKSLKYSEEDSNEVAVVDKFGNPINDLGNTPAAQEQMDALAEQADDAIDAGVEQDVYPEELQTDPKPGVYTRVLLDKDGNEIPE